MGRLLVKTLSKLILVIVLSIAAAASADVMVVGTKSHRGTLEGYAADTFRFRLADGKVLKARRMSVKKLSLKKPLEGTLTRSSKPSPVSVKLLGYERAKFIYKEDRARRESAGMRIKSFALARDPRWTAPRPAAEKIPVIDIARLEARKGLTPEQGGVLERYKLARVRHSAFVAESSRLVAELDNAKGDRRSKLLESLRRRKQDEPPIKEAFRDASDELLDMFPSRRRPSP